MKKIVAVSLILAVIFACLASCGHKGTDIDDGEIKNIVVEAIKKDTDSSFAIVTSMNYTMQGDTLTVRAKVLMPEYCFYELQLEKQDTGWVVVSCGKDI